MDATSSNETPQPVDDGGDDHLTGTTMLARDLDHPAMRAELDTESGVERLRSADVLE